MNTVLSQLTVAVRVRPINDIEKQHKSNFPCVYQLDNKRLLLVDPEKFEKNILRQNRQHERQFIFDATFGPDSEQEEVHNVTTAPLVDFVVAGHNATIFAYGPTGSGKTYTMIGSDEKPGLMMLLTRNLYEKINPHEFTVYLSYIEIYNEVIRDLLNPTVGVLDLLEDERGNVQVPGLSRVKAPNTTRILQILHEGNSRRTQEPTAVNKTSSRSHALLQVTLYKNSVQHGKLFLIDLAGSERASQTKNRGQRLKEGAAINRSLLALGNVINALSSGNKARYVNYRDSKLTRLLKDSLGGNSKTCMIAHISPSSSNYDETYNTLVYANRAKNITTRIKQQRPASADHSYEETMKKIRKEASRRNQITHTTSSFELNREVDKPNVPSISTEPLRPILKWNNSVNPNNNRYENRRFSSLFNSLKSQYFLNAEKQCRFKERLLKANLEAYDVETSRVSKVAILQAWERNNQDDREKFSDIITRLKADVSEQELRLSQLQTVRQKLEKAIRKGDDTALAIENRMKALDKDLQQKEVIDLIVKMAKTEAEKIALHSDAVLQNLRLKKQEMSLLKVQKYEVLADKLINGDLQDEERQKLQQEYRFIKNQLNYHLVPLKNDRSLISWNSQLLSSSSSLSRFEDNNFLNIKDSQLEEQKKKTKALISSVHLPNIYQNNNQIPTETQSDHTIEYPSNTHKLPPIDNQ